MLLFLRFKRTIRLSILESDNQKPWISNICNLQLIFIENWDHSSRRAYSIYFCKCLAKDICRINDFVHSISIKLHIQSEFIIHEIINLFLSHFFSRFFFQNFLFQCQLFFIFCFLFWSSFCTLNFFYFFIFKDIIFLFFIVIWLKAR